MLLKEIRAIAGVAVVLAPHDRAAEDVNTSWLGAPPHERLGLSVAEVVAAFEETAESLRQRIVEDDHRGPATFYVWHDGLAGQLRCSVSSATQEELPFSCEYRVTPDLHSIVAEFLQDRAPGAIVWGSLEPVGPTTSASPEPASTVAVWAYDLRA